MTDNPQLRSLQQRVSSGLSTAGEELTQALARISAWNDSSLFLHLATSVQASVAGPLSGVAVAVKDNIDVLGMPTTAGCPAYAYQPAQDATAVALLRRAGAVPVGKTNLDQFATGLVGVRSPHGVPRNPVATGLIPGGSSSGSACAVSAGLVPLALGTDTAGSGRVPAAFTNIVGLKPTRGLISTRGVVPAVRSLDCVSIFALTVSDAWSALQVMGSFDSQEPWSRRRPATPSMASGCCRVGVPSATVLTGVVDPVLLAGFHAGVETLRGLGHQTVEVDIGSLLAAARLLYGPWVAERTAAIGDFLATAPAGLDSTVASIVAGGIGVSGVQAWRGIYELERLRREAESIWSSIDILALPTTTCHPTVAEVQADPIGLNSRLGTFTNFANLLDTCAIAIPTALAGGRPSGLTLFAPAWQDALICRLGATLQDQTGLPLGATALRLTQPQHLALIDEGITVAVFGAHLRGQPLNRQLLDLGGRFLSDCQTAAVYRCHALPGKIERPGLVRTAQGSAIAGELWSLPPAGFGSFVASIAPPLAIGTVTLDDGRSVKGFVCEEFGALGTPDISHHGSWRTYLAHAKGG